KQRRHHPEARAHLRDEIVGSSRIDDLLRRNMDSTPLVRVFAWPFAGNHDVHTMIPKNTLKLVDISQSRDLLEDKSFLGEQTRDHQRQRRILRSRNRNCAPETLPAYYAYSVHACPARLPSLCYCIKFEPRRHLFRFLRALCYHLPLPTAAKVRP